MATIEIETVQKFFESAYKTGASDIFVREGSPITIKENGNYVSFQNFNQRLSVFFPAECKKLATSGGVDFSYMMAGVNLRVRINLYRCDGRIGLVARFPQNESPSFESLGLSQELLRVRDFEDGLALLVGPTGSGKTTTLSCLLREKMIHSPGHYLTLEDPIETSFEPISGRVLSQRELGRDFTAFPEALKHAMRQAPNTILVGEIRDQETLELAVNLAETGHFVFSSFHAGSVIETLVRLGTFASGSYEHVRLPLGYALRAIIAQKLFKKADGKRHVTCEHLFFDTKVRAMFLKDKINELRAMQEQFDGCTFKKNLQLLKKSGIEMTAEVEDALRASAEAH